MKIKYLLFIACVIIASNSFGQLAADKIQVPLGGNSWVTVKAKDGKEQVTNDGWINWKHSDVVWSTYVKVSNPGILKVSVTLAVPKGESKIS